MRRFLLLCGCFSFFFPPHFLFYLFSLFCFLFSFACICASDLFFVFLGWAVWLVNSRDGEGSCFGKEALVVCTEEGRESYTVSVPCVFVISCLFMRLLFFSSFFFLLLCCSCKLSVYE